LQTTVVPVQAPPLHLSLVVQALPSLQVEVLGEKTQPEVLSQWSVVQPLPSLQVTGVPGTQTPPPQVSPAVQKLPSLQATVLFA
jgi:hypothetical protein